MQNQQTSALPPLTPAPEHSALVAVFGRLEEILLSHLLKEKQFSVHLTDSLEDIINLVQQYSVDVILLDNRIPEIQKKGYAPFLEILKQLGCQTPVIGLWFDPSQTIHQSTGLRKVLSAPLTEEALSQALKETTTQLSKI